MGRLSHVLGLPESSAWICCFASLFPALRGPGGTSAPQGWGLLVAWNWLPSFTTPFLPHSWVGSLGLAEAPVATV